VTWWESYVTGDCRGKTPMLLGENSAPGEGGVSVIRVRLSDCRYHVTLNRHFIKFQMDPRVRLDCEPSEHLLRDDVPVGSFTIHPAGMACAADIRESVDVLMVVIDPARFALAAAENWAPGARLRQRLSGYDGTLFELARVLALEGPAGHPNGLHYWTDVANTFIDGLLHRHASKPACAPRGTLSKATFARIRDYIMAHLDDPIETAALADIAGRSPFHFCRVFGRSVGMSPHRYIVHLRLQCAVRLVREGRSGLADIAACTGFADQSHLSRWVRRVYGVSPSQLAP